MLAVWSHAPATTVAELGAVCAALAAHGLANPGPGHLRVDYEAAIDAWAAPPHDEFDLVPPAVVALITPAPAPVGTFLQRNGLLLSIGGTIVATAVAVLAIVALTGDGGNGDKAKADTGNQTNEERVADALGGDPGDWNFDKETKVFTYEGDDDVDDVEVPEGWAVSSNDTCYTAGDGTDIEKGDQAVEADDCDSIANATASPATSTPAPTMTPAGGGTGTTGTRQETGVGASLPFQAGASVIGVKITLTNGSTYNSCYIASAPTNGTVETGVIYPDAREIAAATPCQGVSGTGTTGGNGTLYGLNPQPYVSHPQQYIETGVPCANQPTAPGLTCEDNDDHTRHWSIQLRDGSVAVIGGFTVDGVSGGVYKAVGPGGTVDTTVTDGFISIVENIWGNQEFCFRVQQAVQYGWAHNTVLPLPGWTPC